MSAVLATTDECYEAFAESPEFARLSDSHQRKAGAITEFFAKYTYEYLGLSPGEWDSGAVAECCTEILPRKVSAEPSFFKAIAPVLSAFFSFLESQGHLPNGRLLAEIARDSHDEIVASANDRSNWGPAKHLVMAAYDAGVDIQNEAALQAFMLQFNLQQAARSGFGSPTQSFWPFSPAPAAEKRTSRPVAGPYEPCPCGSGKKYKFCCERKR